MKKDNDDVVIEVVDGCVRDAIRNNVDEINEQDGPSLIREIDLKKAVNNGIAYGNGYCDGKKDGYIRGFILGATIAGLIYSIFGEGK